MSRDLFSVRWTGQAIPQNTETYTFIVSADDGVRLWLNDVLVVDKWFDQGTTSYPATIAATAGVPIDIRIDYYNRQYGAVAQLEWQSASQPRQVIPSTRLATGDARPTVTLSTGNSAVSGSFPVAVAFSENVTGLSTGDFAIVNGSATGLTGSGAAYTLTVAPIAPGAISVNLPSNSCINSTGQANVSSNSVAVTYTPPVGAVINGLSGDYYSGRNFERLVTTRVDPTVNFSWAYNEGPAPGIGHDLFSVRWTGKVVPQTTETCTFIVTADDGVRLWLNDQLVVDHWHDQGTTSYFVPLAVTAGVPVDIRIDYYQNLWGAVARLEWQSPSITRQVIPRERLNTGSGGPVPLLATASATVNGPFDVAVTFSGSVTGLAAGDFLIANGTATALTGSDAAYTLTVTPAANGEVTVNLPAASCVDAQSQPNTAGNTLSVTYAPLPGATLAGLTGAYYSGMNFENLVVTRVDETVNFSWAFDEGPTPAMSHNLFSARWTGKVTPQFSETYTFIVSADDGVRLWLNDQLVVDHWHDQGTTSYPVTFAATAGVPIDIRIDYFQNLWGAVCRLEWESASRTRQIIPRDRLSTTAPPPSPPEAPSYTATRLRISTSSRTPSVTTAPAPTTSTSTVNRRATARRSVSRPLGAVTSPTLFNPSRGLRAEFFAGGSFERFVTSRTDEQIDFSWPPATAPLAGVPPDGYSVRWTGRIRPILTDTYTFSVAADEGVRLWVNDWLVVDRWGTTFPLGTDSTGVPVVLRSGQFYDLRLEYQNTSGEAWIDLKWETANQPRETVPATHLFQPLGP
jgi:hypothetical protein